MNASAPEYTILLDERSETRGLSQTLKGAPFYKSGVTGVADSIEAVQTVGLVRAPTWLIMRGRSLSPEQSSTWQNWLDAYHERLTLEDTRNLYGGDLVVVDVMGAAVFSDDHERIRSAVKHGKLVNYAMPIQDEERERLLYEGVAGDVVLGDRFFKSFEAFKEASDAPGFLDGRPYAVVRTTAQARSASPSGYHKISFQRTNPELLIAAGGTQPLKTHLDKAESFEWQSFGSHNDGYQTANSGRVVAAFGRGYGIGGLRLLILYYGVGRSVGVAPEALNAFYNALRDGGLEKKL